MKFGLKLWSINYPLIDKAVNLVETHTFDYIELMPIPDTDISPFLKMSVPFVIHATTEKYGFNIADWKKNAYNLNIFNMCKEWADKLKAQKIIIHPGFGSIDNAIRFLDKIDDDRILIENMPKLGKNDEKMIGYSINQVKDLMGDRFGLCLDFGHAIKASISLKRPYREHIEEFLGLNPTIFHLSDGTLGNEYDEHMQLGEGEFAIDFLLTCVKSSLSPYLTLEPLRHSLAFKDDIKNMKALQNILHHSKSLC